MIQRIQLKNERHTLYFSGHRRHTVVSGYNSRNVAVGDHGIDNGKDWLDARCALRVSS